MFNKRPDATLAERVPAYRRMMPYLMPGRNESVFYFEQLVDTSKTAETVAAFNAAHDDLKVTIFHVIVWAAVQTLHRHPRLNRFTAGGKVWQRDGIWLSYSAKKGMSDKAPVIVIKRRFDPAQSFEQMVRGMAGDLREGRSEKKSHVDKELGAILSMPGFAIRALMSLGRVADALGLLPRSFIEKDPMYASAFLANLGSLKMDAGYHHLFEYGSCPIFVAIGQIHDHPVVRDGEVVVRPVAALKYSYDERVEDGFYAQRALAELRALVENPVEILGAAVAPAASGG